MNWESVRIYINDFGKSTKALEFLLWKLHNCAISQEKLILGYIWMGDETSWSLCKRGLLWGVTRHRTLTFWPQWGWQWGGSHGVPVCLLVVRGIGGKRSSCRWVPLDPFCKNDGTGLFSELNTLISYIKADWNTAGQHVKLFQNKRWAHTNQSFILCTHNQKTDTDLKSELCFTEKMSSGHQVSTPPHWTVLQSIESAEVSIRDTTSSQDWTCRYPIQAMRLT